MTPARYIAIEGPIGVGKTTLAHRLAAALDGDLLLESPQDNPFLGAFYDAPQANALPAQLAFLLQRIRQIEALRQRDLFRTTLITDFMFDKDPLFARLNLSAPELTLYDEIFARLAWRAPVPDVVIYLHAPLDVLMARVRQRARREEVGLERDYLGRVAASYADFFAGFDRAPLLSVDAQQMDLQGSETDFTQLLSRLAAPVMSCHLPVDHPVL